MLNFNIDEKSKRDFIASTDEYIRDRNSELRTEWYAMDNDLNPVPLISASTTSRMDLYLYIYSGETETPLIRYSIELKERWGKYTSSYYGNEGQEGWFYNMEKDSILSKSREMGYTPLYGNLYSDGWIRVWNIDKLDREDIGEITKSIKRINIDPNSRKIMQKRYTLMNNKAETYKRIWT